MSVNIKSIIGAWTQLDIKKIQHELDDNVIEIAQKLEEGDASRKQLIEKTKEFRKSITDDQRKLIGPILKQFQIEIDSSNKRSKFMEQILLNLYKQLIDLPDPNPALENAELKHKKAEKMQDLEIENKQLKNTLSEYHEEFANVKNQEVTIKSLKEKIKELEASSEQQVQQRLKDKEKDLQRLFSEKEDQLQSNQFDLVKKLGEAENRTMELKEQFDKCQTDLYDLKQKQDELLNAKTCEIDILLQDLDKLNERAVNAERLADQYQKMLESSSKEQASAKGDELSQQQLDELKLSTLRTSSMEIELVAKEKEISQLVEDVQKLHMKFNKSREFYESQRSQLEERLNKREKQLENMENELKAKNDYDEVKRELSILKTIEFNYGESEGEGVKDQQPLEILLLEKNRHLQNENTATKNRLGDQHLQLETLTKENSQFKNQNIELRQLVIELEKDLHKLARTNQVTNVNQTAQLVGQSTVLNLDQTEPMSRTDDLSLDSLSQEEKKEKNNDSLFNIVSNQRERFKVKCQELESENIATKQQVTFLTNELDQLRSDNVKLYEKIRYLQSAGNMKLDKYKQSDIEYEADTDETVLKKYTSAYESRLDPFSKFSYREKQRRYANLKLHDKFTLNFGRFILSNSTSRLLFCAYLLVIHLLIFFNLYHMAQHTSTTRDLSAECAHAYKGHMAKVHGNNDFHFD